MAINQFNLKPGQRAERKLLITVAEWKDNELGNVYKLQTTQPADWDTKYADYFTKSGDTYTPVSGTTAPDWTASTYYTKVSREILGTRTEDSSIEYNPDIQTSTDIRGINYTDVNKTQPQQDFDPFLVLGGSKLGALLNDIRRRNALSELNSFTIYVLSAFIGDSTHGYDAERHDDCTILYNSIGGDANVNFPISVYMSNFADGTPNPATGTVDKLTYDFAFTPDVSI